MYVTLILLILHQTGWVELQCMVSNPTDTFECFKCKDKYFLSSGWCYACPIACNKCTSSAYCSECKPYYFGTKCQYNCLGCSNENCVKTNGACPSDCNTGYYNRTNNKCAKCRATCKICEDYDRCTECIEGTFLQQVSEHVYCTNCSSRCSKCSDFNTCTQCKQSYYWGTYCQNDCEHCLSDCDKNDGCSAGCIEGYYTAKNVSKGGYECYKCPKSCASCTDMSRCQECKDGFYGEENSVCANCSGNCKDALHCNKSRGSCTNGCRDGWSGDKCDQSCPSGCLKCEQYNSSSCGICSVGLYGDQCERNCSLNCKTEDGKQFCNKSNGYCDYGCKYAFWGHSCENDCGAGCNGSVCNETSGICINGCTFEYYGTTCKSQCSRYCVSRKNASAGRVCHEDTGECLSGCVTGWFGRTCGNKCSKQCNGTICDQINGTCTLGCNEGYAGSRCFLAKVSAGEGSTDTIAIGAGAGAGVVLLATVAIVVAVICWRRSSSEVAKYNSDVDHVPPDSRQTDPDHVYSNVGVDETNRHGKINVCEYANFRMPDVLKEGETKTAFEIAIPVKEDYLKEDETINRNLAETLATDARDVDSNVYGKRVEVVKLPEFIRNKGVESIFADFQRIPKGLLKYYKEARKAENFHKNKYRLIYPYDESRVILHDGDSDYVNASYIEGYNRKKEYIASSGPFEKTYDTTPDFWRMIWQEKCKTIVMLTNPVENGVTKCVKYWPDSGASRTFGTLQVTSLSEDQYSEFTIRILMLTQGGENFNVRHIHFTAWPDKDVPHDVTSMIEFRQKVRSLHKDMDCPLLVHCSAGIGRTGTFIALDMLTIEGEDKGSVDMFGCVAALRFQRCNMVQTKEQYSYLHNAVLHSLVFDCQSIAGDMFLQNYNKLIQKNDGKRFIDNQFQQLQSTPEEMTDEHKEEVIKNQSLSNKNRDGADIPVDEYRIRLYENRTPEDVDYVNAVWINGYRTRCKFIVAQTPLPSTVDDFLTLVLQEQCTCIVMMEEADIANKSVGVYWPADNQSVKHGVFEISCKDSMSTEHFTKKTLSVLCHCSKKDEVHDVHLFIFTNWPKGNAVPNSSDSVLQLVKEVDTVNHSKDQESSILVHCMTGSERSCVYCAVSILIEKMEIEHEVSVVNTLRQIKARRRSAFPSMDQYKFCHQAVISYLQSFDIYSNFGLKDSQTTRVQKTQP